MKTFLRGYKAELKVGYKLAAVLDTWELSILENGSWDEWQLAGTVEFVKEFWFENHSEFTLEVILIPKNLKLLQAQKVKFNGKNILLKGQGGPLA